MINVSDNHQMVKIPKTIKNASVTTVELKKYFHPRSAGREREPMMVECGRGYFCPSAGARCHSNQ